MEQSAQHGSSPHRASTDRRARSSFRICTAQSFGKPPPKRKAGHFTTACEMCRIRKVKCVPSETELLDTNIDSPQQDYPACQPCQLGNHTCRWTIVDGRKKRRNVTNIESLLRVAPNPNGFGNTSKPAHSTEQLSMDQIWPETQEVHRAEQGRSSISNKSGHTPGFEAQYDSGGIQDAQLLADSHPEHDISIAQECPEMQNFVVGLDFFNMASPVNGTSPLFLGHIGDTSLDTPTQPGVIHQNAKVIRLRYYRRFGPTAVMPGLRTLSVVVDPGEHEEGISPSPAAGLGASQASPSTASTHSYLPCSAVDSGLFDAAGHAPNPDILPHLLDVFFHNFGGHFPFLNPQILDGHLRSKEASNFLLNAIAALAARFCDVGDGPLADLMRRYPKKWQQGRPFLKKAKEQLMMLISIPSPDVVAGMNILAWAEFGDGNEAGLWMFAGMAIRMVQDLGLYRLPDTIPDPEMPFHDQARPSPDGICILTDEQSAIHQQKARLMIFWSVFIMDVCVSLATGRPPTIRRSEIEVSVPTPVDMKYSQLDFSETVSLRNMLFPETVRFMLLYAEAVDILNERKSTSPTPSTHHAKSKPQGGANRDAMLLQTKVEMVQKYRTLPPKLTFNIENYKEATSSSQSGIFLMLHLFFFTFMSLIPGNDEGPAHETSPNEPERSKREAMASTMAAQKLSHILTIAHLVDKTGYIGTPLLSHCLFVSASTILQKMYSDNDTGQQLSDSLLAVECSGNYDFLYGKLKEYAVYYGTVDSVTAVLDRQKTALAHNSTESETPDQDHPEPDSVERAVKISDSGIVKRYTIPT